MRVELQRQKHSEPDSSSVYDLEPMNELKAGMAVHESHYLGTQESEAGEQPQTTHQDSASEKKPGCSGARL